MSRARLAELIKNRIDLQSVMEYYDTHFDRMGKALCPFHSDNHPSLTIKNERYKCWACGAFSFVSIPSPKSLLIRSIASIKLSP